MRILLKLCILTTCLSIVPVTTSSECPQAQIKNGRSKLRSSGRRVKYSCRRGFQLYGRRSAWCIAQKWTSPPPLCIASGCPSITTVPNGDVEVKYGGAVLTFTCSVGHNIEGEDTLICDGTSWNHVEPICNVAAVVSQCDFETDLCGWQQSRRDDFDWIWHTGTTATGYTGPSSDHTREGESEDGHYLYIETSSPRKEGDQACLLSPLYTPDRQICFTFWYHMLGPDEEGQVGAITVYVQPEGTTWSSLSPVFYAEGNKGDVWLRGEVFIDQTDNPFQIVIVGVKKISYLSDIAIDDVSLGTCSEVSSVSPEAESTALEVTDLLKWTKVSVPQTVVISTEIEPTQTSKPYKTTAFQSFFTTAATVQTKKTLLKNSTIGYPKTAPFTTRHATFSTTKSKIAKNMTTTWLLATEPTLPSTAMKTESIRSTTTNVIETTPSKPEDITNPSQTAYQTKAIRKTRPTKSPKLSTSWKSNESTSKATKTDKSTTMGVFTSTVDFSSEKQSILSTWTTTRVTNSTNNVTDLYVTTPVYSPISNQSVVRYVTPNSNETEHFFESDGERLENEDRIQPLMIGIGVGIATGSVVIIILVFIWVRNQRLKKAEEKDEEMAPITKHGSRASLN